VRRCPNCSSVHPDGVEVCFCGHELIYENIFDSPLFDNIIENKDNPFLGTQQKLGTHKVKFLALGDELFSLFIHNILLTLITLGFYYFWGKVRIRKYLYNKTEFEGERFAYHGTGKELLIGWMIAALFLGLIFGLSVAAELRWKGVLTQVLSTIFIYLGILFLIPPAVVLSQKYRLSRTSWRGIRFSFRGSVMHFMKIYIPGLLLIILTLGIYYPFFLTNIRKFQITYTYFGNSNFAFDGRGNDIVGKFIVALILSILTLGIYWFWFEAWRHNYYWSHTYFRNARFKADITGGSLFSLKVGNLLLIIFTLGLAWPWVTIRTQKYFLNRLHIEGDLDLESVKQDVRAVSATGEGISDILDIDVFGMSLGI